MRKRNDEKVEAIEEEIISLASNKSSVYVTIYNGKKELRVPRGTLQNWIKNGYREKE